jgi:hypothetical protein
VKRVLFGEHNLSRAQAKVSLFEKGRCALAQRVGDFSSFRTFGSPLALRGLGGILRFFTSGAFPAVLSPTRRAKARLRFLKKRNVYLGSRHSAQARRLVYSTTRASRVSVQPSLRSKGGTLGFFTRKHSALKGDFLKPAKRSRIYTFENITIYAMIIFAYISGSLPIFIVDPSPSAIPALAIAHFVLTILIFEKNGNDLFEFTFKLKLALIPFWIINFIIQIPLSLYGTLGGFFNVIGLLTIPIMIITNYAFLLLTSFGSILFLLYLKKNKTITMGFFILHFIMQICFFWDVVSIIYMKYKKIENINKEKCIDKPEDSAL